MTNPELVSVKVAVLAHMGCALPLGGMLFAIIYSLLFAQEASTATHCKVPNYLPSISAAIALTPQAYVWRTTIALHTGFRFTSLLLYNEWLKKFELQHQSLFNFLTSVSLCGNFVEVLSLLGLSVVSSVENKDIHENFFILFMVGSLVFMIGDVLARSLVYQATENERKLFQRKKMFLTINIAAFVTSIYFYFRHNWYCETGIYTMFALFEYIVIWSNVAYHHTTGIELGGYKVSTVQSTAQKSSKE